MTAIRRVMAWGHISYVDPTLPQISRGNWRLTGAVRKALDGCAGRWPTSCVAAFPATRAAWCAECLGVDRYGDRSVG